MNKVYSRMTRRTSSWSTHLEVYMDEQGERLPAEVRSILFRPQVPRSV